MRLTVDQGLSWTILHFKNSIPDSTWSMILLLHFKSNLWDGAAGRNILNTDRETS